MRLVSRYSIGNSDLINGIEYGWLYTLSKITNTPYTMVEKFSPNNTIIDVELFNGPDRKTRYTVIF